MIPLGLMQRGEKGQIIELKAGKHLCLRLQSMGLQIGKKIEIINTNTSGPLLIKLEDSRFAIGRGMAMKIMVKKI